MLARNSTPNRAEMTMYLRDQISNEILIYAYEKDEAQVGGWTETPAGRTSVYIPYSVVSPLEANQPDGTLQDSGAIWGLPYSFRTYGASGYHVERQSDRLRKIVNGMVREIVDLDGDSWSIMKAIFPTIGSVTINRSGSRPTYAQYDTMLVTISKE